VLLIAKMSKGAGIAGIDIPNLKYMGTLMNIAGSPRHMVLTPDGKDLVISSNHAGVVTRAPLLEVLDHLVKANGRSVWQKSNWLAKDFGAGARTLEITADGRYAFVALNESLEVVMLDTKTLNPVARTPVDAYPVGLAISPVDMSVIVTSQGENGNGGNTVNVFLVRKSGTPYLNQERRVIF
jgi:DNA-binding beta-propeller fold protein YncE